MNLTLVVPLYNESERVAESFEPLARFVGSYGSGSELIFVDDGSSDGTVLAVEHAMRSCPVRVGLTLLRLAHHGKGSAVRAGLGAARCEFAAFCDVDLATPLDELARLVALAAAGPVLVIASRDVVTTVIVEPESGWREFLGKSFNRLVRTTIVPGVYDTQCGAKVAATSLWREILLHSREIGFAWDVEVIAIARRLGIAVWEVGVRWSHDPRSRVRPMRDGTAMVRAVPRIFGNVRRVPSMLGARGSLIDLPALEGSTTDPRPATWPG